jgi:hypothetical protein
VIVWIASYPRSGNLLLRTVIYRTMHIGSYDEHQQSTYHARLSEQIKISGAMPWKGDWETFYNQATESKDIFLVKTHHLPRDNQSAIYVVRDGRSAILSYGRFHKTYTRPQYPSLLELILGVDYYGGWTEHFQAWEFREKTLIVKYEDLIQPSEELLTRLAAMTHHVGRITPWENPFEKLQSLNPNFFRSGTPSWSGDREWSSVHDAIFFHLHGKLMTKLGYVSEANIATQNLMTQEMINLIDVTQQLLNENKRYRSICDERLNELGKLKQACDERLIVIEELKQACDERLIVIEDLKRAGDH